MDLGAPESTGIWDAVTAAAATRAPWRRLTGVPFSALVAPLMTGTHTAKVTVPLVCRVKLSSMSSSETFSLEHADLRITIRTLGRRRPE